MVFYDVKESELEVSVLHSPAPSGWTHEKRPLIECLTDPRAPKFRYILLEKDIYTNGEKLPQELTDYFQIPGHMLSNMYRRSNGFFHCDESFGKDGNLQSHNTWLRILIKVAQQRVAIEYIWYEMTICTRWSPHGCTVLCIAAPASFRRFLQDALLYMWPKLPTSEPYSLHVPALEAIVQMQDTAVWSIRDIIRKIEKERMQEDWVPDFKMLHEAGRHAIHSVETLAITVETLESIQKQCHKLTNRMRDKTGKSLDNTFQIQTHIDSQVRVSRNFHLRSQSNRERLQNEISLGYNIVAQNDSKMMTRLGEASRLDSNAMRTIAVVTMAFLPPTFVSAIFSMSFFEFSPAEGNQPAQWAMSDQFWVYWVFALPLTGLTVAIWYWRNNPTKEKKLIEKLRNHHHNYWHHSK